MPDEAQQDNLRIRKLPACRPATVPEFLKKTHTLSRAGDGNRTHVARLETWSSTIELHPHDDVVKFSWPGWKPGVLRRPDAERPIPERAAMAATARRKPHRRGLPLNYTRMMTL